MGYVVAPLPARLSLTSSIFKFLHYRCQQKKSLRFEGLASGCYCRFLVDSGASASFASSQFCKDNSIFVATLVLVSWQMVQNSTLGFEDLPLYVPEAEWSSAGWIWISSALLTLCVPYSLRPDTFASRGTMDSITTMDSWMALSPRASGVPPLSPPVAA
jgi:hypothetical protein